MNRKDFFKKLILLIVVVFSFSIIVLTKSIYGQIIAYWLVIFTSSSLAKFNIMHPWVWFSFSFGLYSSSYSLLQALNYSSINGYTRENTLYSLLALGTVLFFTDVNVNNSVMKSKYRLQKQEIKILEYILMFLFLTMIIVSMIARNQSFSHKNELLSDRNKFFIIGVYASRFITFFTIIYFVTIEKIQKREVYLLTFISLSTIMFSLLTAERDIMLRFILSLILVLFSRKILLKKHFIFLIPIGVVFLIAGRYFKYFFLTGVVNEKIADESFVYNFLTSDFNAAGENFQILLNNPWTKSSKGFQYFIYDFLTPFLPGRLFPNMGNWFNNTFYPNSYSRAFTILGQGYVMGGIIGIIGVFLILSLIIRYLYNKSNFNSIWLSIYIYSIPTIITSFRSTLSSLTVALVRIIGISLVAFYILRLLLKSNEKNNKI